MFDWVIGGLGGLFGLVGDAAGAVTGWAWDKVITGIYRWLANGLALLIEWVWSVLDTGTTPRVTEAWFRNGLAARVGFIGLAVTIGMMFLSAAQAAIAGRPEQIGDILKESVKAIVASAFTITVIGVLIGVTDEASAMVWQVGRADLVRMLEGMVKVATVTGPLANTFIGPLALLFGFIGLIGLVVSLMMRSALIYVVAAMAPLVSWVVTKTRPPGRGVGAVEVGDRHHARRRREIDWPSGRHSGFDVGDQRRRDGGRHVDGRVRVFPHRCRDPNGALPADANYRRRRRRCRDRERLEPWRNDGGEHRVDGQEFRCVHCRVGRNPCGARSARLRWKQGGRIYVDPAVGFGPRWCFHAWAIAFVGARFGFVDRPDSFNYSSEGELWQRRAARLGTHRCEPSHRAAFRNRLIERHNV